MLTVQPTRTGGRSWLDEDVSELRALNPGLVSIAVGRVVTEGDTATVLSRRQPVGLVATWRRAPDSREAARLRSFRATRLNVDSVELTNVQRR